MHTTFTCPSCQRTIAAQVPGGTRVQCPLCQQVVTVPDAPGGPTFNTTPTGPAPANPFPGAAPNAGGYGPAGFGPPPVPQNYGYVMPGSIPNSGMAVAAMVCGIIGILGVCMWGAGAVIGLVALGLGIAGVVQINRQPQQLRGKGMAISGIVLGSLSMVAGPLIVIFVFLPLLNNMGNIGTFAQRAICQGQMFALSAALESYAAQDPNGMYPDDLKRLYKTGVITPQQLTCPEDQTGGQSYYYVPGYSTRSKKKQVIAYEHPDVHKVDDGGTVLYLDGTVAFETGEQYKKTISNIRTPDGKKFAPHED